MLIFWIIEKPSFNILQNWLNLRKNIGKVNASDLYLWGAECPLALSYLHIISEESMATFLLLFPYERGKKSQYSKLFFSWPLLCIEKFSDGSSTYLKLDFWVPWISQKCVFKKQVEQSFSSFFANFLGIFQTECRSLSETFFLSFSLLMIFRLLLVWLEF